MNFSYNRYHLVNAYGTFGSVTRERHEIMLEGTSDRVLEAATIWHQYGFKSKPGDLYRMPPKVAPYHLRLDWMIWFVPFTVAVTSQGIHVRSYEIWFLRLVKKLLRNDADLLKLMWINPFADQPSRIIRARFYRYCYTDRATRKATGAWWCRELLGEYLEPVNLQSFDRVEALNSFCRGQITGYVMSESNPDDLLLSLRIPARFTQSLGRYGEHLYSVVSPPCVPSFTSSGIAIRSKASASLCRA
ncbi:MAG: lipase maturation factor family protein [Janthinobacterium lividum]